MIAGTWNAVEMFGRLHPLLVHLPIGLLLLLAVFEIVARGERRSGVALARRVTLMVAAVGAVLAAIFGWLLSLGGGYGGDLVLWHQNAGFATAAAAVALLILERWRSVVPYRVGLGAACAVMGYASHLGGSLTHGEGYLTEHLPPQVKAVLGMGGRGADAGGDVFSVAVRPILEARCVDCHKEGKSKGKLRMDVVEGLFAGGTEGPAIVPGNSAESLILQRIGLPEDDEGRMPPEGRERPTEAEIAVLRWWIDGGASTNRTVAELSPPADVAATIAALGAAAPEADAAVVASPALSAADAEAAAKRLSDELGIIVLPMARGEPWLEANASLAGTNFGDAQLKRLEEIGANLRRMDLAGTAVGDAGLAGMGAFRNLEVLHLPRTRVTDEGLKALSPLSQLQSLNLYGTAVSDNGLPAIEALPKLRRVYLWQTKVTSNFAQQLAARLPAAAAADAHQRQIEELQAKIRAARVEVNMGGPEIAAKPEEDKPAEKKPEEGKPLPAKGKQAKPPPPGKAPAPGAGQNP